MTSSSKQCRLHESLLQKSEKLKESHESFCGTKYTGIDRVLVTPVQDLVESSARNSSNAKKIKTEAIPTVMKSAQSIVDSSLKQQAIQHIGD